MKDATGLLDSTAGKGALANMMVRRPICLLSAPWLLFAFFRATKSLTESYESLYAASARAYWHASVARTDSDLSQTSLSVARIGRRELHGCTGIHTEVAAC